jgi:hypothetical protein
VPKTKMKLKESGGKVTGVVTGDAIAAAKVELGSWRAVAQRFNLGSPNSARKLYTELTGKPHTELNSTPGGGKRAEGGERAPRAPRASRSRKPTSTTLEHSSMTSTGIAEAIVGRTLVVKRGELTEEMQVARVRGFHVVEKEGKAASLSLEVGDLCVEFIEGRYSTKREQLGSGAVRTIAVKQIMEVKG